MSLAWPTRYQVQFSELSKVADCHRNAGLNVIGPCEGAGLTRNTGRGYSRLSSAVSLRNLTVLVLIWKALSINPRPLNMKEAPITNSPYSRSNLVNRLKNSNDWL